MFQLSFISFYVNYTKYFLITLLTSSIDSAGIL